MSTKKNRDDHEPRKITFHVGDEPPPPNDTLIRALKGGEVPKPGEPPQLLDRLGAEFQAYLVAQHRVAAHRRTAVKGTFTIVITTSTGPDGSHLFATVPTPKNAKIPASVSMIVTDEDGNLIGAPPADDRQIDFTKPKAATTEPAVGKVSGL